MMSLVYLVSSKFACGSFFGLVPWNRYVNGGSCEAPTLRTPKDVFDLLPQIGLAVLDDLLRIAGVAAVFFIIYGGVQYILSQGSPDQTSSAQQTIVNALIGLLIAIIASAFVSYVGRTLGA